MRLNERQLEVLRELEHANHGSKYTLLWARPLDVGGSNDSHHSKTLAALVKKGLVKRQQRSALNGSRGSWQYRITDAGRQVVRDNA